MKQTVLLILWCFLSTAAFSQKKWDRNQYTTDTTVSYDQEVNAYTFDLEGKKQGFYWGDVNRSTMSLGNVRIRIRNNTGQIISINRVEAGDGAVLYLPVTRYDYIKPEEYIEVRPVFTPKIGPFTKSVFISYQKGTEQKELFITTWGVLFSEEQPLEQVKPADPVIQQPKTKEFRMLVKRGNTLITDQCSLIIWRGSRSEILRPIADSAEYVYFSFPALEDDVFKASIASRDFGRMETQIVCSRGSTYVEFIKPGEAYFYDAAWRTRYESDSNRYALDYSTAGSIPDSVCDSIQKVIAATGVKLLSQSCYQLQFESVKDAMQIEKQLMKGTRIIRLTPLIRIEEREQPEHLSNWCTIVFQDTVSEQWIRDQFKKLGIVKFYKDLAKDNRYSIEFIHSADTGYTSILDKLWTMKEVLSIQQHIHHTAAPD